MPATRLLSRMRARSTALGPQADVLDDLGQDLGQGVGQLLGADPAVGGQQGEPPRRRVSPQFVQFLGGDARWRKLRQQPRGAIAEEVGREVELGGCVPAWPLPARLEPRALSAEQVRSPQEPLRSVGALPPAARAGAGPVGRAGRRRRSGRRAARGATAPSSSSSSRRASAGRPTRLDPRPGGAARAGRRCAARRVRSCACKGRTERMFLSADARAALADYLSGAPARRRRRGTLPRAARLPARAPDGRLSPRAINLLLEQIGRWHDAEVRDRRAGSAARPHDLRHICLPPRGGHRGRCRAGAAARPPLAAGPTSSATPTRPRPLRPPTSRRSDADAPYQQGAPRTHAPPCRGGTPVRH